ncbi:MAG: hypothetical protein K0Q95_755 [Bacteroidota bacterium]|jgi:hypothetical protein|nr:hypothetical protein [Bacteroidota bacterium]
MNIKSKFALSLIVVTAGLIFSDALTQDADSNTSAAPAGRTGSPGDGLTCTSCHAGTATTSAGLITSNIPVSGYTPGQTYTITASITQAGKTKFGFQVSPQNVAGTKLGTLLVTNTTLTQLVGTGGKYITHKTAGTSFPSGTATWSFDWTAPVAGTGNVTFYGAFNITNSSNTNSGDIIKLSTLQVTENVSTAIAERDKFDFNVYPNPVTDRVYISAGDLNANSAAISIINIQGQAVKTISDFVPGTYINVEELAKGYYIIKIETESGSSFKKIVKN